MGRVGPRKNPSVTGGSPGRGKSAPKTGPKNGPGAGQKSGGKPWAERLGTLEEMVEAGAVMDGWTPHCWAGRLRYMAEQCRPLHPESAALYERWAEKIEGKYGIQTGSS